VSEDLGNVTAEEAEAPKQKTAEEPHRITILLGLLSPALALVSLWVSLHVFYDARNATQVLERAYLAFHFQSAKITPVSDNPDTFVMETATSIKNMGNTPAYIDSVKKELFVVEADNMNRHFGAAWEVSPNFDAIPAKDEPLLIEYKTNFTNQDLTGDRSVVFRLEVKWHDAFNNSQGPTTFCARFLDVGLPIQESRPLSASPCPKGMTFGVSR
jgi:hypothetical protein